MDRDPDYPEFTKPRRLFPLPNVVLFPHAILPLHIFEPRYRQMTEDALASDQLVTIVQIRPAVPGSQWTEPVPILDVGCLGKIVQHERLPDGRFNFLLLGWKRVRLVREVPTAKLYRIAEAILLDDQESDGAGESHRAELTRLFVRVCQRTHRLDSDLSQLLSSGVRLGILSDIIAHALDLPPSVKQALLAETRVEHRVVNLRMILHSILAEDEPHLPYPPPFSLN
jgi:Lon protease-like protein